ncbi:NAD(+) diphosphatase [Deltaproteobacteria bacterium Smac51]|nr:NAD(+) diphosphatase [Deltaproteobacteria bacterium Smac51]
MAWICRGHSQPPGLWAAKNKYCGRCGSPTSPSPTERAMVCPSCGNIIYPSIAPVVIVGVINGDKLLMTRYSQGIYKNLALVAGFMEIGETMEDTVRREVMEEVGLEIRNIRYYKSQPWAFSQSVLAGFFADLAGSDQIKLDLTELSEAVWMPRERIQESGSSLSLTYEMIEAFRRMDFPLSA